MNIVNLTAHEVKIVNIEGEIITIPPSGKVAKVDVEYQKINEVNKIPVYKIIYKNIEGLPEPKENTYYIVSAIVKNAIPEREDVVSLFQVHRVDGKPLLAKGLRVNG